MIEAKLDTLSFTSTIEAKLPLPYTHDCSRIEQNCPLLHGSNWLRECHSRLGLATIAMPDGRDGIELNSHVLHLARYAFSKGDTSMTIAAFYEISQLGAWPMVSIRHFF